MLSLICPFVVLVVSHFGFKGGNLVLIAPVPGHCFPFTFLTTRLILIPTLVNTSSHLITMWFCI